MADEDAQDRPVASRASAARRATRGFRAEIDAIENLDRRLGSLRGAKDERHRSDLDRTAEIEFVLQVGDALDLGKRGWEIASLVGLSG
jgi:hypothetical protein